MANPAEERGGNSTTFRRDVETAGANLKKDTETAAGRVGEEFQRAKEQISQTAAAARDDLATDLRTLSDDVSKLKDTVANMATLVGSEIASTAKEQAGSMVAEFERVARRNPLAVVTGALCVGLVIGLMSGRR